MAPKIIKEPGLFYDGENFGKFLMRFERAARAFNASDYDKALQIGRFMKTEDLKIQLEAMDGFEKCEWAKLRKEMIETWGELDNTILYTCNDLVSVTKEYGVNSGIKDHREFKSYLGKFTTILKYLVTNKQIHQKSDAAILFLSAFSRESQSNIKRTLISYDLLPKGPDGSNLPPRWEDLVEASGLEVRIVEPGYFNITGFGESNQLMQNKLNTQKGDSQRRDQMIAEAPKGQAMDKQVEDMAREIALLKTQLKSIIPLSYNQSGSNKKSEFSRGNAKPSTPLYEPQVCYYCKREGHGTYRCHELLKDEEQGLVRRNGKDWYLPNGQHIPWNPARPIRTVVATASADPQMQEAARKLAESLKSGKTQAPATMKTSAQTIDWDPPQLGAKNFLANHAITRSEGQRGRRSVRIQEPEKDDMDIDQEDELANITEETPVVEKVWSKEKPVNKIKATRPEEALLQELDHLKIPTTFAQLTAISPSYTEQIITKLQNRLPEKSSATYITTEATKVSAAMTTPEIEDPLDPCYYSCALGYVTAEVGGASVEFMVDSGSMVNVMPQSVAEDLDLELVQVNIPMKGVGGARCDLNGVVENCPVGIGRFSGPAHLFVSPKAQDCILGRPFLFDYGCTLEYHENGETLSFRGTKGRRVSVPLARRGQGRGWNNKKDLSTNTVKIKDKNIRPNEDYRMFKNKTNQSFL
jgi:hypothetical protein